MAGVYFSGGNNSGKAAGEKQEKAVKRYFVQAGRLS
jgi:hypothetical protein